MGNRCRVYSTYILEQVRTDQVPICTCLVPKVSVKHVIGDHVTCS